ncbi:MAG: hypothetical protein M0035_10160 [Actinomycetota bacterium]|nr:hypothetical protein [Actinomycetota bacterium]
MDIGNIVAELEVSEPLEIARLRAEVAQPVLGTAPERVPWPSMQEPQDTADVVARRS